MLAVQDFFLSLKVWGTTDVVTIGVDDNLELAREIMRDQRIRHLPVVDGSNALVGLITTTNVLAATDSFLRDDKSKLHPEEIAVNDVMARVLTNPGVTKFLVGRGRTPLPKDGLDAASAMTTVILDGLVRSTDASREETLEAAP